ncbi:MAG: glutathionylspermidine synthase family protein [Flavihumibacter sp.]|nr:glutathionylspermidine synthase family protein [Flavihumibacter sp.]
MVSSWRTSFNQQFTKERYEAFLNDLHSSYPGEIEFRVAETPILADKAFKQKVLDACERIVDRILEPDFKTITERSIPPAERVPNETPFAHMIAFDFGICENEQKELEPQLIEMQGFPTLFGFQVYYPEVLRRHFDIPENYSQFLGGYTKETYLEELRSIVLGTHQPEEVILLEIKPHEQKTRIDFYCTQTYLGIQPVCITELEQEGKRLFYKKNGKRVSVKRIYNRVIFDDLNAQKDQLGSYIDITQDLDVEWVPHPNWFYRISKFTMPFIKHPYIPPTYFLNELESIPSDLSQYVLKPLFSFAGQGVVIDISPDDISAIKDPQNWILQKKVHYADVIPTPDIPAKAEIRIMYLWKEGWERPRPAINLARLSKGKMIGVRYNKDKEWVGGSVCFFEQ